jgi:hypothetical protein
MLPQGKGMLPQALENDAPSTLSVKDIEFINV